VIIIGEENRIDKNGSPTVAFKEEYQASAISGSVSAVLLQNTESKTFTLLSPKKSSVPNLRGGTWDERWNKKREHNYQLQHAAGTGKVERIKHLLNKEELDDVVADINARGLDDFTPLHFAVSEGHYEAVKTLLKYKPDIEVTTRQHKTPLHLACNKGNLKVIRTLVEAGANINAQDEDRNTPSHILASLGLTSCLVWFLECHPNLDIKNRYGETVIEISMNMEIKRIFEKYTKVPDKTHYSRTIINGVILHNNRADIIKSFIFRAQLMGQTADTRLEEREEIKAENKFISKPGSRVVKILEIVERIKSSSESSVKKETKKEEEGATADDFEPINLLGKGAFGEVYLVKHKTTNQLYALKTLDKKRMLSENILKYTRTERNVLCVTKHPFIVGLYYAFQNSEKLFMIMQYCPGYSLLAQ